ncbi:MAG: hypothetical protein WAT19_01260 [Ferruginibacter sp.]
MDYKIDILELVLLPVYISLCYLGLTYYKRNSTNIYVKKYLIPGFFFKVSMGVFYALLVYYYWGIGDSLSYFKDAISINRLVTENKVSFFDIFLQDADFFKTNFDLHASVNQSGFWVVRFAYIISYLSFLRFLPATVLFSLGSYICLFTLFLTFVKYLPSWHKGVAFSSIFFPTIGIYGSGVLKDTLCISSLAMLFVATDSMLENRKLSARQISIVAITVYLLLEVKAYIIAAFAVPYLLFLIFRTIGRIKNKIVKPVIFFMAILALFGILYTSSKTISETLGAYALENIEENISALQNSYRTSTEEAGSTFEIGEMEPTFEGILTKFPLGIVATLYRPFIWEVRNFLMLFSALESFALLFLTLFTLYKAGPLKSVRLIRKESHIFLFIIYSLIFSGLVGLSTLNFGTLARYRIPVIPFYMMGILLILFKSSEDRR